MPSTERSRAAAIAAVLVATVLGASSGLYIKGLAFSGLALSGLRMTVPFLCAIPFAARHKLLAGRPGMRKNLFLVSAMNAARLYLYILAYKLTAIGNAVVLLYLWPVFALLIESALEKKKLSAAKLGILFLATAGVVAMNIDKRFSLSGSDIAGSLCMIASAFIFAWSTIIFKGALAEIEEIDAVYFQNGVGAIVFLPFLLAELPGAPPAHIALGLLYGLAVGLVGFGLYFVGMKRLPLFQYSALSYFEIPSGLLMGMLFKGEAMTIGRAVGVALIFAGSFTAMKLRLS